MLELILDGECHSGQRPERRGDRHWRLQARGDDDHYCHYFHFSLRAADAGEALIEIAPDGDRLPNSARSFQAHRPEAVWLQRGGDWQRHPVTAVGPPDEVRLRIAMAAGEEIRVSRMWPYPYSTAVARLEELARHREARTCSLGRSAEGREIAALEIGSGPEPILVLAGQHPAEFSGARAVIGIAEWLLSELPEAREIGARYRVVLTPVLNPDGNVGGRCGYNARGADLYRAFADAAGGAMPAAPEAACLWQWVQTHRPALALNFHTFTQPSPGGSFPWEGMYIAPDEAFAGDAARARQRKLDARLAWETDGLSQYGEFSAHLPAALEYQLAALGVPNVFYEVQDAVGPNRHGRTGVHVLRTAVRAIRSMD